MPRRDWPTWWEWELELSVHLLRRMLCRDFNETDLRTMLADARAYERDVDASRWVVQTRWHGLDWEVIVEPDAEKRRLVVVTAYAV